MTPLLIISFSTFVACLTAAIREYVNGGNRLLFDLMRVGTVVGATGTGTCLAYYVTPQLVIGHVAPGIPMAYLTLVMFCGIESAWLMLAYFVSQSYKGKHPFGDRDKVRLVKDCQRKECSNRIEGETNGSSV